MKTLCQESEGICTQCGVPISPGVMRTCDLERKYPRFGEQKLYRPGLGDNVEAVFKSLGITEDRYKAAKKACGLPPTCNCPARKAWLNKVSDWWRGESE